jgi:site-specific recombinase XerD
MLTRELMGPKIREALKDKRYRATPLGEWVGRYIRWMRNERGCTEATIRDYEAVLARMALTLDDKDPTSVTIDDLREVIDLWGMREPKTRAKVTSVVRSFWSWAEEEGWVPVSPAARLRRPKVPRKVAPLLPERLDLAVIDAAPSSRDRVALACLLWLGIRRGELCGIQVRDFDMDRRELRVFGKGQKERVLPLRGQIVDEIAFYLNDEAPFVGRTPEPDDFLLYPTKKLYAGRGPEGEQKREVRGYPKTQPSVQYAHRWWYRMLEQARLVGRGVTQGMNMHRARHTFARDLRREAGIEAASEALGHSDLSTTLGIYGHSDLADLERAMEAYAARKVPPDE